MYKHNREHLCSFYRAWEAESKHSRSDLQVTPLLSHRTHWRHERTTSVSCVAANNGDVQQPEYSLDRSPVDTHTHTHVTLTHPHRGTVPFIGGTCSRTVGGKWEKKLTSKKRRENSRKAESHREPYCYGDHPDSNTGGRLKMQASWLLKSPEHLCNSRCKTFCFTTLGQN